MFQCERCGSSYSARHTVAMSECPRCLGKDRVSAPLTFKAFSRIEGRAKPRSAPQPASYLERELRA
jgi:hypothetical protein